MTDSENYSKMPTIAIDTTTSCKIQQNHNPDINLQNPESNPT